MMKRAFLLLLCSTILISVQAQKKSKSANEKPLFTINKKPVSADEFIYLYKKNHQNPEEDYTLDKIEEYLRLYVNFKLKVEEARHRGMDTTAAFKREFKQYKEEIRRPYLPETSLIDSLSKLTYERMKEEVRAAHILVRVSPDADPADTLKAYNKILSLRNRVIGGEDFFKVASEFSEDESARANKGELGYFTAMQMVFPFENAAFTTKVGDVSNPVRTRFGYHILKVFDRRQSRGEVEVAHIMIRYGETRTRDQAKNLAFEIHEELQGGMSWDEACREHSEDPGTKENGGRLRPFGVGVMSNISEFERVAFELERPGQISDPVETQYGWHILRLIKKIPLASYDEMSASLKSKVARDERSQISRQAMQQRLRRELGFKELASTKASVFALADSTLKSAKWNRTYPKPGEALFSIGANVFSAGEFVKYVRSNQKQNSLTPQRYMEQLYENFIDEQILSIQEQRIVQQYPEFRYLLNEYYEGILLFEIMEKEVWNKASDDSLGQANYYKNNAAKYQAKERVRATIYSSEDKRVLDELRPAIEAADARAVNEVTNRYKIRVESGYFERDARPFLQKVEWSQGLHTAENNGIYYLARILEVLPAGQMSFEEARPALISDFQNFLEETWVSGLRKKFKVKIDENTRKQVVATLQKGK